MISEYLAPAPDPKPITVLLVDDEQDSYILTKRMLGKATGSFQLEWASNFESGLKAVARQAHDVYLFDYRLGSRNGLELLKQALVTGCRNPIIMLTTENPAVDSEAMRLGAADFLNKDRLDAPLLERSIRYSIRQFAILRALHESQAQLASFMKNVPCAVYMKDAAGRYLYINEACEHFFHRPSGDCLGRTDEEIWPRGIAQKQKEGDRTVLSTRRVLETTETVPGADGSQHHWLASKFPILNEQDQPIMIGGAAIDITERKRLEQEVQEVSERERRKIGQDLHDGLGQYLTGIACHARAVQQRLESRRRPEAADLAKIAHLVNQTITQARDLARGLCPVQLETAGLQASLHDLCASIEKLYHITCNFDSPEPVVIADNAAATHLYRIVQEAINNAVKHGHATQVEVSLGAAGGTTTLQVKDNGRGFLKGYVKSKGMGLRVMHYRAGMIGASISIESNPGGGTVVSCAMPQAAPARGRRERAPRAA